MSGAAQAARSVPASESMGVRGTGEVLAREWNRRSPPGCRVFAHLVQLGKHESVPTVTTGPASVSLAGQAVVPVQGARLPVALSHIEVRAD
ncbi:MAG: hypothetical protein H6981_04635 [Gammaproteobacteria bacterium]|nr:hypothetical protein [Gammaproteobacteria bacterium]